MKNIIIFGASGDTGMYLVDYFLNHLKDDDYYIIASGTRKTPLEFINKKIEYIQVDITNEGDFSKLPSTAYAVIDLAGLMPARMKGYYPKKYVEVNILGTMNILEYCKKAKVDRILFSQSFGDIKDHAENDIILYPNLDRKMSFSSDHTVYVLTKNFAVDMIKNYHELYGIKNFIFRLPTIYLYSKNDTYFVDGIEHKIGYRILIDKAIHGESIEIWGDPTRKKDMIYVKDFCQMLYKATFADVCGGHYNVGTGIGISLDEQIRGIVDVFTNNKNKKSNIIYDNKKKNAPQYIMDISNAVNDLGYKPEYDYKKMLFDFRNEMIKDGYPNLWEEH